MATFYLRCQVVIGMDSALPEDAITNTFHFIGDAANDDAAASELELALTTFYGALDGLLYPVNVGSEMVLKWYNMEDSTPRAPFRTQTYTIVPSATAPLPAEVALVTSFQGDRVSGQPQARRRGRLYLGPLATSVNDYTGGQSRPDAAIISAVVTATEGLKSDAEGVGGAFCVYSPTTDQTETVADAFVPVTNGWVDNAFDTQRRRGVASSSRSTWS